MKILFLDFDGVLHPEKQNVISFCENLKLWEILERCPDVFVVFSTSWRICESFDTLVSLVLSGHTGGLENRFIGVTPDLDNLDDQQFLREAACKKWLLENKHEDSFWLAIDDDADGFSGTDNLHLVNGNVGLTILDVEKIVQRFA
jgi:hypothetical protein